MFEAIALSLTPVTQSIFAVVLFLAVVLLALVLSALIYTLLVDAIIPAVVAFVKKIAEVIPGIATR